MPNPQFGAVEKLARYPRAGATPPAAILGVTADRMPDGGQVHADLVRAACLEADPEEARPRQRLDELEVRDGVARAIGGHRVKRPVAPPAPDRGVDGPAPGIGPALDQRQVRP